ncbi:tetratricopeptide repeat protein 9C-like [Orbicella faveolata]|uniref:tetratricopeptide repeat protein 9C-like n=1 Tax=Orbicella faveolata TaxID=48498 RepID=UPI0009E64FF3|nr:tetratricopeptide repeat protein 9C-like [Orbicella faveolata]
MAAVEDDEPVAGPSKVGAKERIQQGAALKAEGNEYFKKKEYRNAMKCYHKALLHVRGLVDQPTFTGMTGMDSFEKEISDEDKEEIYQVQFSCYNNLAACLMKDSRWDRTEFYCNEALKLQPQNAKALFRRGQSYFHMKDFEKAERDLKAAEELEPKDSSIKKMLGLLEVELRKVREKEKKIYAGMFDRHAKKE